MICERIHGSIADDAPEVDWVEIDWPQTVRRALRLKSRGGRRVDILLPPQSQLRHGDLVFAGPPRIAIWVRPCDLLEISPPDATKAAEAATHLGNLHIAVELRGGSILTPNDGPAVEIAEQLGVPWRRVCDRFHPLKVSVQSPLVRG
ncbi:MAG TPA: hypothetical protein VGB55_15300 [Tepidisphaeraceae bacterium]